MEIEPGIKKEMRKLGCKSDVKITLALHLYIHLVDEKQMYDTEYCYNEDIDTLYVVARKSKTDKMNIYVPVPTYEKMSLEYIYKVQENLCTVETGPSVSFAIIDGDFTTVIYSFTKDIVGKGSPETITERRRKEGRRNFINNELRRCRYEILHDAFDGGVIDDDVYVLD